MKFEEIYKINVNEKTEKKNGLTYLSWAWAWAEFCKIYPDATYKIYKNEQGLPYVYDELTGYMCYVEVTAGGVTHEMWLPVMDSANNAMKSIPYVKKTKYKEVKVDAATMFDINKTIMRCLVKCLAMFGLGLYIYAGEDLPEDLTEETLVIKDDNNKAVFSYSKGADNKSIEEPTKDAETSTQKPTERDRPKLVERVSELIAEKNFDPEEVYKAVGVENLSQIETKRLPGMIAWLEGK